MRPSDVPTLPPKYGGTTFGHLAKKTRSRIPVSAISLATRIGVNCALVGPGMLTILASLPVRGNLALAIQESEHPSIFFLLECSFGYVSRPQYTVQQLKIPEGTDDTY
jgi:hypothetical protein